MVACMQTMQVWSLLGLSLNGNGPRRTEADPDNGNTIIEGKAGVQKVGSLLSLRWFTAQCESFAAPTAIPLSATEPMFSLGPSLMA